jgi:hypothetical protein
LEPSPVLANLCAACESRRRAVTFRFTILVTSSALCSRRPPAALLRIIGENADAFVITHASFHEGEILGLGEVRLKQIDRNALFTAIRNLLHSGTIARNHDKVMGASCKPVCVSGVDPT